MIWQTGCNEINIVDDGRTLQVTFSFKASAEDRKRILQEIADNKLINRMY